ncbi:MAG: Flagellar biosynthesis protein FliR, partial [uncultured Friedmanniella sp.]
GPHGPVGDPGRAAAGHGAGDRLRRPGPAVQLQGHPAAGQGRPGARPVPGRLPAAGGRHAGGHGRLPGGRGYHRGRHRGGAGLRRPGALRRRATGRRHHRPRRGLLPPAGLRPAVADDELGDRPAALPAGHHAAVHQRRPPHARPRFRDLLRGAAAGRLAGHRAGGCGHGDRAGDDVPGRPADRRADGGRAAAGRRRPGVAEQGSAGAEHVLARLPGEDHGDPDAARAHVPAAAAGPGRADGHRRAGDDLLPERV